MEHDQGTQSVTREDTIDALGIAATAKVTYTGAGFSVLAWLQTSGFGVLAGVCLAALGYFTNLWFQHRRDKREAEAHNKFMASLRTKPGDLQ